MIVVGSKTLRQAGRQNHVIEDIMSKHDSKMATNMKQRLPIRLMISALLCGPCICC